MPGDGGPGGIGGGGDPEYRTIGGAKVYVDGVPGRRYLVYERDDVRVVDTFKKMTDDPGDTRTVVGAKTITLGDVEVTFKLDGQHVVRRRGFEFLVHVINCELAAHHPGEYFDPEHPHELVAIPHIDMSMTIPPERGLVVSAADDPVAEHYEVG